MIRRGVLDRYERAGHVDRVAASTDRMLERWGDVLDRLGSVCPRSSTSSSRTCSAWCDACGAGPVRDVGLLDAAVARPRSSAFGADAYPPLEPKAAALLHSIVREHALVDGNERLGWLARVVFCDINGVTVTPEDDDAFQLVMEAAQGGLDVEDIAARLRA